MYFQICDTQDLIIALFANFFSDCGEFFPQKRSQRRGTNKSLKIKKKGLVS